MIAGPADPHFILIGLPGVGKSTVGAALARHLERLFVDFDAEIERSFGLSVSEIFAQHGEPAFREAEVQVSQRLASQAATPAVLSPGGGWVANVSAVAHLRPVSRIIYLRVAPAEALLRLGNGIDRRPLFAGGEPAAVMQQLFDRRHAIYTEVADIVVDTDGAGAEEVLRRVLEQLRPG